MSNYLKKEAERVAPSKQKSKGTIFSINISKVKGLPKQKIPKGYLAENSGLKGDAHAGCSDRQVSLLSWEAIRQQEKCPKIKKKKIRFKPGDFAENITIKGLDLTQLKVGKRIFIKNTIILEVSQIGKKCHNYCAIYKRLNNCIMPKQGIFTKVISGGKITTGDPIYLRENGQLNED